MRFLYKAKNDKGELVTGTVRATTEYDAEKILVAHNLVAMDVVPEHRQGFKLNIGSRITLRDRALFARQLSTMISAGLPLTKAITIIATQARNDRLKGIYHSIYGDLEEGLGFSRSLAKHPEMFDRVFVSVVNSGETTGKLDIVLNQMATQLENDNNFIGKVKSVMYYPAFILLALVAVGIYMLKMVVPQLKSVFDTAQMELPIATRMLLKLSDFIEKSWAILILVIIIIAIFTRMWFKTEAGKEMISRMELKIPVMKDLFTAMYIGRFARVLGMLSAAGVPLLDALKTSASILKNHVFEDNITKVIGRVEKGIPLSVELMKSVVFPNLVGQMVAVGEETGQLDKVLGKVADYYEEEVSGKLKILSSLIEPIVLVIIGLAVAFMVFAILVPIFNLSRAQ